MNDLLGGPFADEITVTLAYRVPLDAQDVSFEVDDAAPISIPVTNLG